MPILQSISGTPVTIQTLETETVRKLENQVSADRLTDIDRWLRDALIEISGNTEFRDDFDQLEEFGPTFNLTGGRSIAAGAVQEYAFSNIVPVGDYNLSTLDILIWIDYPTNATRRRLRYSSYQASDKTPQFTSTPSEWYRFADTFGLSPVPDKNYQVQARILRRHPIVDYFNQLGQLNTTVILLPNEYFELLEWAAAERGFAELLNYERAAEIHTMIHGDPEDPARPGIIKSLKSRRKKENWRQEQSLRPIVHRYSCGTRGGR